METYLNLIWSSYAIYKLYTYNVLEKFLTVNGYKRGAENRT